MSRLTQTLGGLVRRRSLRVSSSSPSTQTSHRTRHEMIARAASMAVENLECRRLMSAGQLDATFGTGGIARTEFPDLASGTASRLVATSAGVLAIGTLNTNTILLAEYAVDGGPAAGLGDGGKVLLHGSELGGS